MAILATAHATDSPSDEDLGNVRFVMGILPAGSARRANSRYAQTLIRADQHPSLSSGYDFAMQTLQGAGYTELGWFPLVAAVHGSGLMPVENFRVKDVIGVGGFTKIEQYDDAGKPMEQKIRWSQQLPPSGTSSLTEFFQVMLHGAKAGKYRAFFVAVSETAAPQKSEHLPNPQLLRDLRISGARVAAPSWMMEGRAVRELILTVIVYEFTKSATDGEVTFHQDSDRGIDYHLEGGGLIGLFKQ